MFRGFQQEGDKMADESVTERRVGDLRVITVQSAELTSALADKLLSTLRESMSAEAEIKLVLDLSNVKFIDSVALGTLVVLLRRIKEARGRLALAGLAGHCLRVMQVTGMEKVFELYGDVAAAAEALQRPG